MDQDVTGGAAADESYFDRIGGQAAVATAVDQLYALILADDRLAPYFTGVDLPRLKRHMVLLLTRVLGGPDGYTGRELADAHRGLGITEADYDRVGDYLLRVLAGLGVDHEVTTAVSATLDSVAGLVVSAGHDV
jgi:truncated hemoglobin YjbI